MSDEHKRFWEIIADSRVCMVTTVDQDVIRSRPMAPFVDTDARTIHFVTDGGSAKLFELNDDADIALAFSDTDEMVFASVSGKGVVSRDRDLIHKLWGPYCDVFFDGGPENADVAVIKVLPSQAEYWDNTKGKIATAVEMTRAYFGEGGPDIGENAKLDLNGNSTG